MTKEEAKNIPELQIHPDELLEDCFYYKLARAGRLTEEAGRKALKRAKDKESNPRYQGSLLVADLMVSNLDKYGVPCIDWCK